MRKRLDQVLVDKSLAASRSRARDVIVRGLVEVNGELVEKPGYLVDPTIKITISDGSGLEHVSRGALKLKAALAAFSFDAEGAIALDIGASTGGFTEVLLEHGADKVFSVDVGRGQLHNRLRADPRVVSLENCDARTLTRECIPAPIDALVADVSFISLTKVLPTAMQLTTPAAWMIALIKPQFEVGPGGLGKDGLVKDGALRSAAIDDVRSWIARQQGWHVVGTIPSPVRGSSGNYETLIGARRDV
ncbi:MAG: TlyA family RNA methyltransferase [Alphaproteobacteria bacterium]|nr:TlyA family RNA methyltransferase [Alphaproteobacteria bacterium]